MQGSGTASKILAEEPGGNPLNGKTPHPLLKEETNPQAIFFIDTGEFTSARNDALGPNSFKVQTLEYGGNGIQHLKKKKEKIVVIKQI